jgi:RluA family pseudouridine synthase
MNGVIEKSFTPEFYRLLCEVTQEYAGLRLDQFVHLHFPSFSRQFIQKKIRLEEITFFGRTLQLNLRPSLRLLRGDRVQIVCPFDPSDQEFWRGEPVPLDYELPTIYQDDDVLAVNKPPFMITHPAGRHVFHCATVIAERNLGFQVNSLHRIDRETSGILLLGKNTKNSHLLSNLFEDRLMKKAYFLVAGAQKKYKTGEVFTATESIGPRPNYDKHLIMECFPSGDPRGKEALTHFLILFQDDKITLALAFPKTGRQHQIRVHGAFHGLPLLGDKLYSGDSEVFFRMKDRVATPEDFDHLVLPRQALHAFGIYIGKDAQKLHKIEIQEKTLFAPIATDIIQWLQLTYGPQFVDQHINNEMLMLKVKNFFVENSARL